jgi:hypothetical protein
MNRKFALLLMAVISLVVIGLRQETAEATHVGDCPGTPITTASINEIAQSPPGINLPLTLKECVQQNYNNDPNQQVLVSNLWLENHNLSVALGDVVNATLDGSAWLAPANFSGTNSSSLKATGTSVVWPGSGTVNATGVVGFTDDTLNFGGMSPGQSRGDKFDITIDSAKLRPGLNRILIDIELNIDFTIGFCFNCPASGTLSVYVNVTDTSPPPPPPSPSPPAPAVSASCSGATSLAEIVWDSADDPAGTTAYYIDIDTSNSFNFGDGYWSYSAGLTPSKSDAPAGFYEIGGTSRGPLVFNGGSTYHVRIFYDGPDTFSELKSFAAASCSAPTSGASCIGLTITPSIPEPDQAFTVEAKFKNDQSPGGASYTAADYVLTININGTDYTPGYNPDPLPPQATAAGTVTIPAASNPGRGSAYSASYKVKSNPGVTPAADADCPAITFKIASKPYFRVYGGDVLAGAGQFYSPTCDRYDGSSPPPPAATIEGWNKNNASSSDYGGAGVQIAAQALGAIDGFASSFFAGAGAPPLASSFANSGVPGAFGGSFGTSLCSADHYDTTRISAATDVTPGSFDPGAAAGGDYRVLGGDLTISAGTLSAGKQQTIFVEDGDVTIEGDIKYDTAAPWASPNEVPSFQLIVRGDIIIAPGVTQLDGVYIAQPSPSPSGPVGGGTIYTCKSAGGSTSPSAIIYPACNAKLTVNGAFIAHSIRLLRTEGLLHHGATDEASTTGNIAEVFNFTPELFIRPPGAADDGGYDYDSITSLPPVL